MLQQDVCYVLLSTIFYLAFYKIRGSNVIVLMLAMFWLAVSNHETFLDQPPIDLIFLIIALVISCLCVNKIAENSYVLDQIQKNRFKKIMDISMEGILIIKEDVIDYVNDKFIEQQKTAI